MEDVILREINEIISSPENRAKNPVSLLMEAGAQSRQPVIFNYLDELAMGLINTHIFTCEVKVGRVIKCKGSGHSKKEAKANCAKEALELIRSNTGGTTTSPGASKVRRRIIVNNSKHNNVFPSRKFELSIQALELNTSSY